MERHLGGRVNVGQVAVRECLHRRARREYAHTGRWARDRLTVAFKAPGKERVPKHQVGNRIYIQDDERAVRQLIELLDVRQLEFVALIVMVTDALAM